MHICSKFTLNFIFALLSNSTKYIILIEEQTLIVAIKTSYITVQMDCES